jgi:hypothetical protein
MFVRGVDEAKEYNRQDNSFYKGIVVKNDDPMKLYRVKVYIPEITNQPLDDWFAQYKTFNMRFPGKNNKNDSWVDVKMYEQIASLLPWAEPCLPLMGESGIGRFNSPSEIATLSDTDFDDYFETNTSTNPSLSNGAFSPAYFFENYETSVGDAFIAPISYMSINNNPYSFLGRPSKHVNKSKGVFGVPSVGSKVWVFHYSGDINFPVYFGARHDFRETSLMLNLDQPDTKLESLDYPGVFENRKKQDN